MLAFMTAQIASRNSWVAWLGGSIQLVLAVLFLILYLRERSKQPKRIKKISHRVEDIEVVYKDGVIELFENVQAFQTNDGAFLLELDNGTKTYIFNVARVHIGPPRWAEGSFFDFKKWD
jgi:hypothetical protein